VARDPHQLREEAASAVARGKLELALELYGELEQIEPMAAAWPKRVGETYRRIGDAVNAVVAFERAVDKYVHDGLLVQAIAVCKLILQIDPNHASTAARLSELATPTPAEVRARHVDRRSTVASDPRRDDPPTSRAALLAAAARAPVVREPAILPLSPAELAQRAAVRKPVALPPGGGLDAIPLAMVMPDSQRVVHADGTDAGVSVLRIDVAFDDVDDEVEIELVDPHRIALLKTPVFSGLPADALERLIGQLELRELYNGEELFHEGDSGATMFVISEGEVEVAAYGQELAILGPGAFFGEISLITDLPRSATIRAKGRVELLALDREVVRGAAVASPEIIPALLSFVRARLVDRVSRTSPLFRPFSEDERAQLAARFEVIEVDAGARLIKCGDKADGLYVVLAGKVDVTREGDGSLATLSCGDVFGEMSLLGNRGSTANVHALTRVLALRLPAKVFQEIVVTYPQVLEFLGDLTSSRSRLRRAEEFLDLHITLV
jgi:CRP-like cAMP-binding protein